MDIDARSAARCDPYRPFSMLGAVHVAISNLPVGGSVDVHSLTDCVGKSFPPLRLSMCVNRVRGEKRFTCRSGRDGILATVTRIS